MSKGTRVMAGCFPVGTELGCCGGRPRRVREQSLMIACCFGMVRKPTQIGLARWRFRERDESAPVQRERLVGRDRLLHDDPSQLVPERDRPMSRTEYPGPEALLDLVGGSRGDSLEQPQLSPAGKDRDRVEQFPRWSIEPRRASEDSIADRVGDVGQAGAEDLGDEERISPCPLIQLVTVDARKLGQGRHRVP